MRSRVTEGEPPIDMDVDDDDDDDDDDVAAEESYRKDGLLPLIKFKRFKAYSDKMGYTKISPDVHVILDARLKRHLRELVARSIMNAASCGRKVPTNDDAIAAVEEMNIFPPVIYGGE